MTFQDFTETWFADYANLHLEEKTIQLYRHMLKLHIIPAIGHLKLSKVLPAHLNKIYNTMSQERKDGREGGYAPKTIKHVHNIISGIYSAAVKWNIVTDNPCDRVEPPKQTPARDKVKYFTLEQTELFLSLLDKDYSTTYKAHDRVDDQATKESEKLPDIPLHGLRHTSATLLISQNVDVKTVSNRLGHSQTSTTMDIYSHALQKMDEQAAATLDTLLAKKA